MFNLMHKDGMNKSFISIFALCVAAISVTVSCTSDKYVSITGYAQGGSYVVKLNLQGRDGRIGVSPEKIKAGIDSVTVALDNSLSGYNDKSLLTRFNNGERIVPDSIFADIYRISYGFFEETGGAFDVAAGPLFDIWGFGFKEGSMPSDEMVAEVRESCGMRALYPDISGRVADDGSVCSSDMVKDDAPRKYGKPRLNFNAIAQGYTCDIVADYLYSLGVKDMLINIGGEIYCDGLNPSGKPWTVGVDRPVDGNNTPGAMLEGTLTTGGGPCGIVTSGNYRKFYVKDGRKYAHTVDPRTGYPASDSLLSATVVAKDATTADALATYCMVIGFEKSKEFISSRPDLEGYLIYAKSSSADSLSFGTWESSFDSGFLSRSAE